MPDPVMYELRQSRADPPGQAARGPRRKTYTAALNQFDELLAAAREVSAASRPLLIFYALSQAGRAIIAAHGSDLKYGTHGLTVTSVSPAVARTVITPKATGAFPAVCDAMGAPRLPGPVELGALWAALPDLWGTRLPVNKWPRAMPVYPYEEDVPGLAFML